MTARYARIVATGTPAQAQRKIESRICASIPDAKKPCCDDTEVAVEVDGAREVFCWTCGIAGMLRARNEKREHIRLETLLPSERA